MTITVEDHVNIDAAKGKLDVAVLGEKTTSEATNTTRRISALVKRMCQLNPRLIVVQATGGYEEALVLSLFEAGMPVASVSPQRVRQYAKARGILAKTDKLDAQNLAAYEKNIQPRLFMAKSDEGRRLSAILGGQEKLLRTAKPIRPVTAATLLADLPELGELDRKQIAA
jgi:transposase